jgi:hypothetical protein
MSHSSDGVSAAGSVCSVGVVVVVVAVVVAGWPAAGRHQEVRTLPKAPHRVGSPGRDPVGVARRKPPTLIPECDIELPGHLVGGLLALVCVRRRGDAILEEDLVRLQPVTQDQGPFGDTVADGLERLGRGAEQ